MAAIYSKGGNRWNILGFNFTKRDALSSLYKISMVRTGRTPTPMAQMGTLRLYILMLYNVVFWPSEFCQIFPQSTGNGISETPPGSMGSSRRGAPAGEHAPEPPRKSHLWCLTRVFRTRTRGPSQILNSLGAPENNVTPLGVWNPKIAILIDKFG
jgi:hypothetical protein